MRNIDHCDFEAPSGRLIPFIVGGPVRPHPFSPRVLHLLASAPPNKRSVASFNQCLSHGGERGGEERPKASLLNLNTGLKIELAHSQPLIRI